MVLNSIRAARPGYPGAAERFPLTRVPQVRFGLDRLVNDESQPQERRDRCRLWLRRLATFDAPCQTFYPKACRHSARMARESGTMTGAFLALGLNFWSIAWPLAYVSCWLAEKSGATWRNQYAQPIIRANADAERAWQEQLAAQGNDDAASEGRISKPACLLEEDSSSRIEAAYVLPRCASIEVLASDFGPEGSSLRARTRQRARAQVNSGQSDATNTVCLRFFSGQGDGGRPQEIADASDWLGQIAASLRALRFPHDLSQARAAIKAASDFSWVERFNVNTHAGHRGPQEVEGVAVVPHAGQVFIANAGRCRTFAVGPQGVRQLAVPHERDAASEQSRVAEMDAALGRGRPSSRSLSTVATQKFCRPQVTAVSADELIDCSIISVSPGVIEYLGARAWQEMLIKHAQEDLSTALQRLAESVVAAGYLEGAGLLIYRLPTADRGDL